MNPTQKKIIDLFDKNGGTLPTFREIARQVGVASTNTVSYHIEKLRREGYLDIAQSPNGIANLSLKSILALDAKPGVYVALCAGKPFFIGSSTNLRKNLLETIVGIEHTPFSQVEHKLESITIAFHIVPDNQERAELKDHLLEFYRTKGITL